ncbi:hypothetical protein [Fictibacillus barbaricus]|uniref:Plasmid segregation centromere-binding protein ParR n=1 Tax=Fictibacillus barbaricus TaxID=182136 RepID=A0ABS2ZHK8_9BACL|nr:hypothetical protein [Fictibacillus barbaricus]MBN3546215.1 hypothetical protein [Fictibacillus barbaricus]GGB39404.1 hypothetical protein GCM10007199_00630 [Fictibacillus barbaricus]
MDKKASNEITRGKTIAFRIPSDTPDHVLKQLQKLKETERRNFSSRISEFVLQGVGQSIQKDRETITIPLPKNLSKMQRDWLKHEHSEALLGNIMYQLISNPVRTASILAALNSNSTDIDQALYLQEDQQNDEVSLENLHDDIPSEQTNHTDHFDDDDLSQFDWNTAKREEEDVKEEPLSQEQEMEDLLGDFLAHMNK